MQKNLSNKELVAAGHKFAANISADTPLIDMAKMVSELATQLDVALAAAAEAGKQRDTLATENAALVNYIDGECYTESKRTGVYTCAGINKPGSPATDAYIRKLRNEAGARAVELFSQTLGSPYSFRDEKCYEDGFTRAIQVVRDIQAPRFAAQLRAGNAGKDGV